MGRLSDSKEYALYKGDNLLCMGTVQEIAEEMCISQKTVRFYGLPVNKRRSEGRGSKNYRVLVYIGGDDEDD